MPHPNLPRLLAAGLLCLAAAAGPAPDPAPDPALEQTVRADEATATDQVVVDRGHVDLGPRFIDGAWRFQARDDREVPPVWRWPHDLVLHLPDVAVLEAPDNPDFAFLGVAAGDPVWVVPQTQAPDVVWLGWNTQDPEVTRTVNRGASLTLHAVDGPGDVFLFLQEGVTGPPNVLWDSTAGLPQSLWMEVNTHVHANWVFTAPGTYLLQAEMHADLLDGATASDGAVLRVAVGDGTDPHALLGAPAPAPGAGTGATTSAVAPADDAPRRGLAPVLVAVVAGAGVLTVALAVMALGGRRARTVAAASHRDSERTL